MPLFVDSSPHLLDSGAVRASFLVREGRMFNQMADTNNKTDRNNIISLSTSRTGHQSSSSSQRPSRALLFPSPSIGVSCTRIREESKIVGAINGRASAQMATTPCFQGGNALAIPLGHYRNSFERLLIHRHHTSYGPTSRCLRRMINVGRA